jgi:hypothetical protein
VPLASLPTATTSGPLVAERPEEIAVQTLVDFADFQSLRTPD